MGNQMCSSSTQSRPNPHAQQAGLQAELQAAYQEGECIKRKLKLQDAELVTLRGKMSNREDEWDAKLCMYKWLVYGRALEDVSCLSTICLWK